MEDPVKVTQSLAADFNKFIDNLKVPVCPTPNVGTSKTSSFASVVQQKSTKKVVKIKELRNSECVARAAVAIPFEAVEAVSSGFVNTLYGYFKGDRLAFPLNENYVTNT
ncbi:hypothetical protein Tco_1375436 [Tanacetum coccineum]